MTLNLKRHKKFKYSCKQTIKIILLILDKWIKYFNSNCFLIVLFIIKFDVKIYCKKNTNVFKFNLNGITIIFNSFINNVIITVF